MNAGNHLVYCLREIFGEVEQVTGVTARLTRPEMEGEDHAIGVLKYRSGAIAELFVRYDGGKMPPPEIAGEKAIGGGLVLIGNKGSLPAGRGPFFGNKVEPYPEPKRMPWDYDEVHSDWTNGIKFGRRPSCDFAYAGPFTEAYLLGNIALKVGHRVEWNANSFQVTNCREANQYLSNEYRKGWELPG